MSEITLIMLGVRLALAALQNAPIIKEDIGTFNAIVLGLIMGRHPTPEQLATLSQLTAKILAADLAAIGAAGVLGSKSVGMMPASPVLVPGVPSREVLPEPAKMEQYHDVQSHNVDNA